MLLATPVLAAEPVRLVYTAPKKINEKVCPDRDDFLAMVRARGHVPWSETASRTCEVTLVAVVKNGMTRWQATVDGTPRRSTFAKCVDAADDAIDEVRLRHGQIDPGPEGVPDFFEVDEDTTTRIAPGVLANDRQRNGAALSALVSSTAAQGTVTLAKGGSFEYSPRKDFAGTDSFTYKVEAGGVVSRPVRVTITVRPVNDPPVAVDDFFEVSNTSKLVTRGGALLVNDLDVDSPRDVLRTTLVGMLTPASAGQLAITTSGGLEFIPAFDFTGDATFHYQAQDESTYSKPPAKVTIRILEAPVEPVVYSVEPSRVVRGTEVTLRIRGDGLPASPVISFAGDIEVDWVAAKSNQEIEAHIRVDGGTDSFGLRPFSIEDKSGSVERIDVRDKLKITDVIPQITAVYPSRVIAGRRTKLTVRGSGIRSDATLQFAGVDLLHEETRVVGDELHCSIFVPAEASIGERPLRVLNGLGESESDWHKELEIIEDVTPPPPSIALLAGGEVGYSYWSGGRNGPDEHYQSSAFSGDFVGGGTRDIAKGYSLDVLVSGYGAVKTDRRSYTEEEQQAGNPAEERVSHRIAATALRVAVRRESDETGVSLGAIVGGFQDNGCRHDRTGLRNWSTPACGDYQQWAAFPTFSLRLGPVLGPYATLGFLDGRTLAGNVAHIGAGKTLRNGTRAELVAVASTEGVGPRLSFEIPWGDRLVLLPAVSGGMLYDTFVITDPGHGSFWLRGGLVIGMQPTGLEH